MSNLLISELITGKMITNGTISPTSGVQAGAASHDALGLSGEEVITRTNLKFY